MVASTHSTSLLPKCFWLPPEKTAQDEGASGSEVYPLLYPPRLERKLQFGQHYVNLHLLSLSFHFTSQPTCIDGVCFCMCCIQHALPIKFKALIKCRVFLMFELPLCFSRRLLTSWTLSLEAAIELVVKKQLKKSTANKAKSTLYYCSLLKI